MNEPAAVSVTQPWIHCLPLMQQTVLLTAIRGPDGIPKYGPTKMLLRWYRRCVLLSSMEAPDKRVLATPYAFGGGSFTGPSYEATTHEHDWRPIMDRIVGDYLRELDAIPHHFQLHFMHGAQIVGYKHPDGETADWWLGAYHRLVHDMHLYPEGEADLDLRLSDNRDNWLARNDPATVA